MRKKRLSEGAQNECRVELIVTDDERDCRAGEESASATVCALGPVRSAISEHGGDVNGGCRARLTQTVGSNPAVISLFHLLSRNLKGDFDLP